MLSKTTLSIFILVFLTSTYATSAFQTALGPGDLDPTFGANGKVRTDFSTSATMGAAALQPDGKIVAAGVAGNTDPYILVRYMADGSPDPTFGPNGKRTSPFIVFPRAIAIQPDGKIMVGGVGQGNLPFSFVMYRLHPDGSTDTTFGSGGLVVINFSSESSVYDVAILPDGKILASGEVFLDNSFLLVRLNPNGTLDSTFGTGGIVRPKIGAANQAIGIAHAIAIQPDMKIVAAGVADEAWAIARFHPDGQLDDGFSNDGKILFNFGIGTEVASDVVVQPDGKIVVAGFRAGSNGPNAVVARLNSDGSTDNNFGSGANGIVQPLEGSNRAASLVLEASGKILVAGDIIQLPRQDFMVMRLNIDGTKDTSFAVGGVARTDFGIEDSLVELMLQPDGKVVAAGTSFNGGVAAFVLARYLTAVPDEPVLQLEAGTNHAIALDSVTFQRDPFSIVNDLNFSADHRTRIILFVSNLTVGSSDNSGAVTVQAQDSGGVHILPAEFVAKVPGFDSLIQVTVKLPDGLAKGNVLVSVSFQGKRSNKGVVEIE